MTEQETSPATSPARRWPRRLAIGAAAGALLLGGAWWLLGREATLQALVRKVADASGGSIVVSGVSGSLYGAMHMDRIVYRSPERIISADNIDIDWSPLQYLSSGIAISKLHAASLRVDTLRESEPAKMPATLAPPFALAIEDARVATVTVSKGGASTVIANLRFRLRGDRQQWVLRDASAATPWGQAAASASVASSKPFKLAGSASLTQTQPAAGQTPAQLKLRASGDLAATQVNATGQAGRAVGEASLLLAPFEPVPLRTLALNGSGIDPGFFNPALPSADLALAVTARIDAARAVAGKVTLANQGPAGTLDQQRLPLRALRAELGGDLSHLRISDVLVDFGAAGRFTGSGSVQRGPAADAPGRAVFALHTGRLDLKGLHSRLKATKIAGDIRIENAGATQTLHAQLADSGMRLDAMATLAGQLFELREARLSAGAGSVRLSGSAHLDGTRAFKASANAQRFNPAALGNYPEADINADMDASGVLAPAWKAAASFALRPSRLFKQPLSGKGKFDADATHVSAVAATLALGQNLAELHGSFGAPGERLVWRVDGRQPGAVRSDLYGALVASGAITGTMAAPRTSFDIDAKGLGWTPSARAANDSVLHASGEAWLAPASAKADARSIAIKTSGSAQRLNPAAFGAYLAGSINASFDASARLGPGWSGSLNLALQPSTLAQSPLWGHARLAADAQRISQADIDLHLGPNILAANGSFGAARDLLDWRVDAGQLGAFGPNFGGALRASGTLSGTMQAPSLSAALDGQNLKLFGSHQVRTVRASANLGSGRGPDDALVSDIALADYASGETRVASARLQTSGTRAAHTLRLAARGPDFDASGAAHGGWSANAWSGSVDALQNKGRYAFALQAPAPLRLAPAPGAGVMGLVRPERIALGSAVFKLSDGSIRVQSLDKEGSRWSTKGAAAGVPLTYLAQLSPALRETARGDLALGAQWALDLQGAASGAAPALSGMLHVFRERGDLIVGAEGVVLGLRLLDLRADVVGDALRLQMELDGARAGHARVDANAQLLQGRIGNDSPLRLSANADMGSIAWLAPLAGQPGLELDGVLKLALSGSGTIGAPALAGNVTGDQLALRWPEQGVKLRNGQLRAELAGDQLLLRRLSFDGEQGRAVADGTLRFAGGEASMQLKLAADKLEILSRPDRTLVVTGQSTLTRDAKRFQLDGKFRADRALIELAPQGRPTLSDDVIVLGRSAPGTRTKTPGALALGVDIEADLGDAFRLRGMGLDAELAGTMHLRAASGRAPRATGSIRVVSGTYAAYGQKLSIERGVLNFTGAYDNPALNILALRKQPEGEQLSETNVEAGVEVRGTALAPAAKLVSRPSVPDSDKLSWLVLGHGLEGTSGNEASVLSAAAGALLGGAGGGFQSRLASSLGVDELALSQAKGLETTVVMVGKRISQRAYLSFEQGATTASSLVKLRYKLNPRVTLQFQTGTNTALDVLYSWAFD